MKYPYNAAYEPPFPAIEVVLDNIELGMQTSPVLALLDTGADGSLVPLNLLYQIRAPVLTETRIRSHWGEWRSVQLFLLDVVIGTMRLPGVFVVGDNQGNEVVLGRNVLNKMRLILNCPANTTDVSMR
jgi:hypothetical protein